MEILTRKHYADKVDSWIGKGNIIVLVGPHRVGKSSILKDFIQRHSQEKDIHVIYVDKEKKAFKNIKTKDDLDNYIESHYQSGKHNYILVDEVQQIEKFEESICSWYTEDNTDVIITGSNSQILSGDLSTLSAGRYVEIRVHPLTYPEFLEFHSLEDSDESLMKYLNYGGLPGLRQTGLGDEYVWSYLSSVFDTIMLKDIIERHDIRNVDFLNYLIAFYADTTGKLTSANSISKYMKSQGESISSNLVLLYRSFYEEAYLLNAASRYDIHGKRILESKEKVYWDDLGLRNLMAEGGMDSYMEKAVIENAVYKHLCFLGYNVQVGVLGAGEVDFVCTKPDKTAYVQVTYLMGDQATRNREFGPLEKIRDNHPKYVISATPLLTSRDENGIKHISLREFLTKGI